MIPGVQNVPLPGVRVHSPRPIWSQVYLMGPLMGEPVYANTAHADDMVKAPELLLDGGTPSEAGHGSAMCK